MSNQRKRRRKPNRHKAFLNEHRHKYEKILAKQGGHCALCPRVPKLTRRLDMDHHHGNMILRGLLCVPCNRALRDFMDEQWLKNALKYINSNWNDL